jgi:hypothetical protein
MPPPPSDLFLVVTDVQEQDRLARPAAVKEETTIELCPETGRKGKARVKYDQGDRMKLLCNHGLLSKRRVHKK